MRLKKFVFLKKQITTLIINNLTRRAISRSNLSMAGVIISIEDHRLFESFIFSNVNVAEKMYSNLYCGISFVIIMRKRIGTKPLRNEIKTEVLFVLRV